MKTFRKILLYLALAVGVLVVSLTVSVFLFKDKIINQFIREANKQLSTPVKVGKIDISVWQNFPRLSIVMHDVYVEDSQPGQYPLLTAREISFQLSLVDVWNENYAIKGLQISDSETNLKIDDKGVNNYTIAKGDGGGATKGSITFELKNVNLKNTRVHYTDNRSEQRLSFFSKALVASIHTASDIYNIDAAGDLTTEKIEVNRTSFLAGRVFDVESQLTYDDVQKILTIKPSLLNLSNAGFDVSGTYSWKKKNYIDLVVKGKDTDIQTLLSLVPGTASKKLEKYKSSGDVYFNAKLKGEIGNRRSPGISIDFGFKNATVFHPDYKSRIEDASLDGSFASPEVLDVSRASLVLKNINGKLNGESFAANFILHDFENPEVISDFKGRVDAASVLNFYPIENLTDVSGALLVDVSFKGRVALLKKRATAQQVSTQGTIDLQNIGLTYGEEKIKLRSLMGNLQFSNNDLALSNVSGFMGNSDFTFNGFFKNIVTFLLFENQPIGIETDLKSNFLDVDQLFAIGFGKPHAGKNQQYEFGISRNINLNFNCDVKGLRYKRFHAENIKGDLLVKNEMAVARKITLHAMGGDMTLAGIVDAHNPKAIDVVSNAKFEGIYVDSVFYVFENFDQDFIQDKHLKGRTYADVNLEMTLNQNLKLFNETLISDITATIKNGELNNFEPMKKLNRFLNDEGLSKLRFSDIKNDIHIENKTIYIPQMEVRTNVTSIKVSGTHTFDQHIEYHIIAPLRNDRSINSAEARAALEEDGSGQSKLFLKITGTTDDYRIAYDTEAVRKKIATDLKKEVQELKDAFKNKGTKKKKEVELEKDEYFDWDN
ncbi:AsmA family protein [Chryseolinea lacunae]|uniref:AsmA-like C-terminal domain-containing protein n=1 Tax=Chryseolinea lacunae TaxID=2801331 RepID=A0ABS1KQ17_9BACT|nr:AsmA-like C-terminal region-containing protein [Chryseolinea lacunae]MBL0741565.1 hypothetical protein [Chryseolinea lacunae]